MVPVVASTTVNAVRTGLSTVPTGRRVATVPARAATKLRRQFPDAPTRHTNGKHLRTVIAAAAAEEVKSGEVEEKALELPTSDESDELLRLRHSAAHMMAMAVQRLFPGAMCTIGPWIERGFYYDFDMAGNPLTESDLKKVQKEMERISRQNLPFIREEVAPEEARSRIEAIGEPYKIEILDSILAKDPTAPITIFHIGQPGEEGSWWDLCAGPHVEHTGKIRPKGLKLESLAGAYWRGDESRPMLQRVYGTAWQSKEQLKAYELMKEEAAKRDHRKLGKELKLFSIQECAGGGLVFWHPKGAAVRNVVENYWKEVHLARGYELIYSPHVAKLDLWKTSGHYEFYSENMYDQMKVEEEVYQLKPMNCPFHIAVYQDGFYSYRDLPLRWAELGTVYRYERSGTMHGLFRVRGFTQDDGHIFCTPDQISDEIRGVLDLTQELLGTFGFTDYEVNLSTRPEKSVGDDAIWDAAEAALAEALGGKGWDYVVDEGGGAFYGPKIDIKIKDAIGRKWQCATVQLDFNLPERFGMEYIDEANTRQRPIMIHRAILGSIERFFGVLIENYAGAFPLWMAPVQARILPVTDDMLPSCYELKAELQAAGVRVDIASGERLAKLVRTAELSKIPVMAVVGKRDLEAGAVSVRTYADGDLGSMPLPEFQEKLLKRIADRESLF
eukprot:CAMPEP_0177767790 /NCGR_PEP_ID=MMETSP0491_2-20121128/9334_1 /TAXON_ID=63592 /ORGANISM="Tetraselmis chuii, Strain PLY429" /LENGTH=670 /DNA_ID=CAMNT_0019284471 /DNA_START=92 /DNA_END=2104 /DNA_ORIENTATION=-